MITSEIFDLEPGLASLEINGTRFEGNDTIEISTGDHFVVQFTSAELISRGNSSLVMNWMCNPQSGRQGSIELLNYSSPQRLHWEIQSECDYIHLKSTTFDTYYDFGYGIGVLFINEQAYWGSTAIDKIIEESSFVANLISDADTPVTGFSVQWSCFTGQIQRQNGLSPH